MRPTPGASAFRRILDPGQGEAGDRVAFWSRLVPGVTLDHVESVALASHLRRIAP